MRKANVLVVEDAAAEFFRRAHEHAEALDRGEALAGESSVVIEEAEHPELAVAGRQTPSL